MAREVNLVPDIKNEMLKALKLRNYTLFGCIVVAIASVAVTGIVWLIMSGQQAALDGKKATLDTLSSKVNSYSDLDGFLTIKDQLGNLSVLSQNKTLVSRTFDVLSALIPRGADKVTISKLDVDLTSTQPTLTMEAQANAGSEPYIDYNVLDAFKKSMSFMKYDYGKYVDKTGATIPAYCMIETKDDGSNFATESGDLYAYWTIDAEGCNPSKDEVKASDYAKESYNNTDVVRIWRTPQLEAWYDQGKVTLDGQISGIEHFESACIKYTGVMTGNNTKPTWTPPSNETCFLVPGSNTEGTDGITITESSNGIDESKNELVLRFSAKITIAPEVYKFTNTHMLALGPSGRYNVTDSYVQLQELFAKQARECKDDDELCKNEANEGEE